MLFYILAFLKDAENSIPIAVGATPGSWAGCSRRFCFFLFFFYIITQITINYSKILQITYNMERLYKYKKTHANTTHMVHISLKKS
jgi:hypothetical protein